MAFSPKLSGTAKKYFDSLDRTMQDRVAEKIREIAEEPFNIRISKPLRESEKRSARVGKYRILFIVTENTLLISEIGPRNQVYRKT